MHTLAIAVTNRCPLRCSFCCVPPGPGDLDVDVAENLIKEIINLRTFSFVGFTGGEPLLRYELVTKLGLELSDHGIIWGLTTGAGWATTKKKVDIVVSKLVESKISNVTVSVDEEHLKNTYRKIVPYLIETLTQNNIPTTISSTSDNPKRKLPILIKPSPLIKIDYHYISPTGAAKNKTLNSTQRLNFTNSRCPMTDTVSLSVWPDGKVYPCCSTHIVHKRHELSLGNIKQNKLGALLDKALEDTYLCAIREIGFSGVSYLTPDAEIWKTVFENPLLDVCHLCSKVASSNSIIELRKKLNESITQDDML